jgi:OmpA-OmpF porin, OOP family
MAGSRRRRRKMPAFGKFNPFDVFIDKIALQYRLGPKGRSLVRETFDLIAEHPGGVGGFVERFKVAGLAAQVASRLGLADAVPLTALEVEQALGAEAIGAIAAKAGVSQGFAKTVLGKTIPNIVGFLMESGFSGEAVPPSGVSIGEIAQPEPEQIPQSRITQPEPVQIPLSRITETGRTPLAGRLIVPGAALIIVLGVAGYFLTASRGTGHRVAAGSGTVVGQIAPPTQVSQPAPSQMRPAAAAAPSTPAVISHAPSIPARLALSNDNGLIAYSGVVGDDGARAAITDSLKRVFGADNISGDLRVDQFAGPANWSKDLRTALDAFKTPGSRALFEGATVRVGGKIPEAERNRIVSSLKSILGPNFALAAIANNAAAPAVTAANTAPAQTATLPAAIAGPGGKKPIVTSSQAALNLPAIYFTSNSVKIPAESKVVLAQIAARIKQLPGGSLVWISGFTTRSGNAASNINLSQRRANSVRQALVKAGVNPAMLIAKGYGNSRTPVGTKETTEGRSNVTMKGQPRVEFHIVEQ